MAQGGTVDFYPSPSLQAIVDRAMERDPIANKAEYLAEFRSDLEQFLSIGAIKACIKAGVHERLPERRHRYVMAIDPSGGSVDSMTCAIAHKEADTAILDCVREVVPPFSPEMVCNEFADLAKRYRIVKAHGDKYAGEWPREQFRKYGLLYDPLDRTKSELYVDLLPLVNSGAVDLLDHTKLVTQLSSLERSTARSGKDAIDHPRGAHDDVSNACAAACVLAMRKTAREGYRPAMPEVEGVSKFDALRF